ncbi:MAG: hypothetical protein DRQ51_04190 [Gammaproteobacteria bacterium]|nr:MAG: hypothetical protein DRQ51_04190 [Gammaproteobacteria bacterium]
MHSLKLHINDSVFDKIINLLKNFSTNDVMIVENKTSKKSPDGSQNWQYWSDNELDNFANNTIGLSSNDFDDDDEDYSKW